MKPVSRITATLIAFLPALLLGNLSHAEVSVRECIFPGPSNGEALVLPADGQWRKIGTLKFDHLTSSDYVVQGMVHFSEDNTPDSRIEYQFILDGAIHGWYTRRVPKTFPSTQTMRTTIANVDPVIGGHHELSIRARNLSTSPAYYRRFWISPLLVDKDETSAQDVRLQQVTTQSSWVTLAETTITASSSKLFYLAAYAAIGGGTSQNKVEYRLLRDGIVLETFADSVPDQLPDGNHLALIDTQENSGTRTFTFQGRSPSGSSVTFGARELRVQTIPSFTVLDIDEEPAVPISVPNDGNWHTVGTTSQPVSASSIGTYGTDGSGFAQTTYTGTLVSEAQLQLLLDTAGVTIEVGLLDVTPSGRTKLETLPSDWEQLGNTGSATLTLQAKSPCLTASPNLAISDIKTQVVVLPDELAYTFHPCSSKPNVCCANVSSCEIYECVAEIVQTFKARSRDCF